MKKTIVLFLFVLVSFAAAQAQERTMFYARAEGIISEAVQITENTDTGTAAARYWDFIGQEYTLKIARVKGDNGGSYFEVKNDGGSGITTIDFFGDGRLMVFKDPNAAPDYYTPAYRASSVDGEHLYMILSEPIAFMKGNSSELIYTNPPFNPSDLQTEFFKFSSYAAPYNTIDEAFGDGFNLTTEIELQGNYLGGSFTINENGEETIFIMSPVLVNF